MRNSDFTPGYWQPVLYHANNESAYTIQSDKPHPDGNMERHFIAVFQNKADCVLCSKAKDMWDILNLIASQFPNSLRADIIANINEILSSKGGVPF